MIHLTRSVSKAAELLYTMNPLAAGSAKCERGKCRTKRRLAGWTPLRERMPRTGASRWQIRGEELPGEWSLPIPFPSLSCCLFSCSLTFSMGIRCSCLCVCTVCICLYILYFFSPSTSLYTFLSNPKSTVRKKHLAFTQLKAQQKHFPSKWLPHNSSTHSLPAAGHKNVC